MPVQYWPFDSGAGASIGESSWIAMARLWLKTGVVKGEANELAVYADSTGMQVKVPTGTVWAEGQFCQNTALTTVAVTAAHATLPRIDRVVMRKDNTAKTFALVVIDGTPASPAVAPAITQTSAMWDVPLAQIAVGAAVTTIAAGNVTDQRVLVRNADVGDILATHALSNLTIHTGTLLVTQLEPKALQGFFGSGSAAYAYAAGNLSTVTWTGGPVAGLRLLYTYDGSNRVSTIKLQTSNAVTTYGTITYTYNGDNTIAAEVHS